MSDRRLSTNEPASRPSAPSSGEKLSQRALPSAAPRWLPPLVAILGLSLMYVLTGPGNRSEADDAFWFADDIEHGTIRKLFGDAHTAHLLFLPLGRALFNTLRLIGIDVRAYDAVRLTNCLVAATAVVIFGSMLRRRFRLSMFAATTGAAGLAVSYGFWRYANETEAYAVAILLIVVLCLVGFSGLRSTRHVIAASIVAAFGAFIHVLGVIPALVVVPFILLWERRIRDVTVYLLGFAILAGMIGYGAYRYAASPQQSFADYLSGPSPDAHYSARIIPESAVSLGQDIATTNFLFAYPSVARRIVAAFPTVYLVEEQYAGEHSDRSVRIVPLVTVPVLLLLATALVWSVRRRALDGNPQRRVTVHLAAVTAWIVAYWLVVVRWSSSAPEAWIPLLPAVWILIAVAVLERARTNLHRAMVVALLAVLAAHNLTGGFWMMHSRSTDFNAVKARWLMDHAGSDDAILTADGAVFERYLRYFSAGKVVNLEGLSSEELANVYAAAVRQPGQVFATAGVFDPPSQLRALDEASFHAIEEFASTVEHDFRKVFDSDVGDVYERS